MSGPILPNPRDWLKLPGDMIAAGFRMAWRALTGRWHQCPYDVEKQKCLYARGGTCHAPMGECPK